MPDDFAAEARKAVQPLALSRYVDAFPSFECNELKWFDDFRTVDMDLVGLFDNVKDKSSRRYEHKAAYVFRKFLRFWDVQCNAGPTGSVDCGGPETHIVIEAKLHGKSLSHGIVYAKHGQWMGLRSGEAGMYAGAEWERVFVVSGGYQDGCLAAANEDICLFTMSHDAPLDHAHQIFGGGSKFLAAAANFRAARILAAPNFSRVGKSRTQKNSAQ